MKDCGERCTGVASPKPLFGAGATVLVAEMMVALMICALVSVATAVVIGRMERRKRRNLLTAVWIVCRWPWVAGALGLTVSVERDRLAWYRIWARRRTGRYVRKPVILPSPDAYGVRVKMWTLPGVSERLLVQKAENLADAWRMHRVSVTSIRPGRLMIRGMRIDPLTEPVTAVPENVGPRHLFMGVDEWADPFYVNLAQIPGITVGGLSGKGKTTHCHNWIKQLAEFEEVQFAIVDGKGGGDYEIWKDRCWRYVEDDLPRVRDFLRELYEHMQVRQHNARGVMGVRDVWKKGPTKDWPMIVLVLDECQTFFNTTGHDEGLAQACRFYVEQLVRKGRSVLICTILLTQKQTHDSIPTAIRDNCEFGICFSVRTKEAAVAALGDEIREWPDLNPANLQGDMYIGVAVVSDKKTGGFVRVKCPDVDEEEIADMGERLKTLRGNPVSLLTKKLQSLDTKDMTNVIAMKREAR